MGRNPKETTHIAQRRQRVAALYIQGWFQTAIAQGLGISQPTVCQDLQAIRKQWRDSAIRDFDALRERELQKLDLLEREAWAAWKRSQEPAESTRVVQDGSGKRAQKTEAHRVGDPRYLEQVHKCVASRRAILGLDAPVRVAPTSPDGETSYHAHVMVELMRIAEEAGDGPRVIDAQFVQEQVHAALAGPGPEPPDEPKVAADDEREA
jgi:hypothetical protein